MRRFTFVLTLLLTFAMAGAAQDYTTILDGALFGMVCDGSTSDVAAFNRATTFANALPGGGTIKLPTTGHMCVFDSPVLLPANVSIRGCGTGYTGYWGSVVTPSCGILEHNLMDSYGGIKFEAQGSAALDNLYITTDTCYPMLYDTNTVFNRFTVMFDGHQGRKDNAGACNTAVRLADKVDCPGSGDSACFSGFGTVFNGIYTNNIQRAIVAQSDVATIPRYGARFVYGQQR